MNNKGYTLIELVMTLGLLSMVIVVFSNIFVATVKIDHITEDKKDALQISHNIMETIKSMSSIDLKSLNDTFSDMELSFIENSTEVFSGESTLNNNYRLSTKITKHVYFDFTNEIVDYDAYDIILSQQGERINILFNNNDYFSPNKEGMISGNIIDIQLYPRNRNRGDLYVQYSDINRINMKLRNVDEEILCFSSIPNIDDYQVNIVSYIDNISFVFIQQQSVDDNNQFDGVIYTIEINLFKESKLLDTIIGSHIPVND